jgi:hypothetical protein
MYSERPGSLGILDNRYLVRRGHEDHPVTTPVRKLEYQVVALHARCTDKVTPASNSCSSQRQTKPDHCLQIDQLGSYVAAPWK